MVNDHSDYDRIPGSKCTYKISPAGVTSNLWKILRSFPVVRNIPFGAEKSFSNELVRLMDLHLEFHGRIIKVQNRRSQDIPIQRFPNFTRCNLHWGIAQA